MIRWLVRHMIKNSQNVDDPKVREKYGVLGGVFGILCNIVLFIIKLCVGIFTHSLAVISDALNNLADMGSSVISFLSAKLSNRKSDSEHPYGHGRMEYVCSLIVSFLILFMGFELFKEGVSSIISGSAKLEWNWILIGILIASVLIKVWMWAVYRFLGKKIHSSVLLASSTDSISDVFVSLAVITSMFLSHYVLPDFPIDGILSCIVALVIFINGGKLCYETIQTLLGKKADKETTSKIAHLVLSGKGILGIHDLQVHDYGPGRMIASVHAEISDKSNIVEAHEIIDALEVRCAKELNIPLTIHMDPISVDNPMIEEMKNTLHEILQKLSPHLHFHDLRMTDGVEAQNLIFDLEIPYDEQKKTEEWIPIIKEEISKKHPTVSIVIRVDYE